MFSFTRWKCSRFHRHRTWPKFRVQPISLHPYIHPYSGISTRLTSWHVAPFNLGRIQILRTRKRNTFTGLVWFLPSFLTERGRGLWVSPISPIIVRNPRTSWASRVSPHKWAVVTPNCIQVLFMLASNAWSLERPRPMGIKWSKIKGHIWWCWKRLGSVMAKWIRRLPEWVYEAISSVFFVEFTRDWLKKINFIKFTVLPKYQSD